jgi:hypothetical protein
VAGTTSEEDREGAGTVLAHPDLGRRLLLQQSIEGAPPVITFLGMIIFATIIGIGSLDGRSGLGIFGKYTASSLAGLRPRPIPGKRRRGGDGPTRSPGL